MPPTETKKVLFPSMPAECSQEYVLATRAAQMASAIARKLYTEKSLSGTCTLRAGGASMEVTIKLKTPKAAKRKAKS